LRRAQSLALQNGTALRISREFIRLKLEGQATLVRDMLNNEDATLAIERFRGELAEVDCLESIRIIEAQAARCYWQAWSNLPVRWPVKERRIPEHWKRFGSRISLLTQSPRLAINPPNAILNLAYALCESEARIACVAMGLDSAIGLLHVDTPRRDSLACDVMEVCRPKVDAFVLNWLQTETLRKADFIEGRDGACRLSSALAIKLCETAETWRRLLAPTVECVAQELWASAAVKGERMLLATRLTQRTKRFVKDSDVALVKQPQPPAHACENCGTKIRVGTRLCWKCSTEIAPAILASGRKMARTPESLARKADTQRKQRALNRSWNRAELPAWLTCDAYIKQVLPALSNIAKHLIRSALGVSEPYASNIQTGKIVPHPRHWLTLARVAGISQNP